METIRYENKWPWGVDIMHIATDGKATVGVSKQDGFDFAFIHDLVVTNPCVNRESANTCWIWPNWKQYARSNAIQQYCALFRVRGWNNGTERMDIAITKANTKLMDTLNWKSCCNG